MWVRGGELEFNRREGKKTPMSCFKFLHSPFRGEQSLVPHSSLGVNDQLLKSEFYIYFVRYTLMYIIFYIYIYVCVCVCVYIYISHTKEQVIHKWIKTDLEDLALVFGDRSRCHEY